MTQEEKQFICKTCRFTTTNIDEIEAHGKETAHNGWFVVKSNE